MSYLEYAFTSPTRQGGQLQVEIQACLEKKWIAKAGSTCMSSGIYIYYMM